jgi:flagellar biosynthesis protein FlhG
LVTTPEPTAILDAYALLKIVLNRAYLGMPVPQFQLIMNKSETREEAENALRSFKSITKKYLNHEVHDLGYILYDSEMPRAIKHQKPLIIDKPGSRASRDIMSIAAALVNEPDSIVSPPGPLAKIFSRLFG